MSLDERRVPDDAPIEAGADGLDSEERRHAALSVSEKWACRGVPGFVIEVWWDPAKGKTNKAPLTVNGFKDATTDIQALRRQFNTAHPRRGGVLGVGLLPGVAGLIALDIDGDREVDELEQRDLPATYTVTTASGYEHRWFRKREPVPVGTACAWPEVDVVRADDGFVVAPGTETPWGSWTSHDDFPTDIAEAPIELWDAIERRNGSTTTTGSSPVAGRGLDQVCSRLIANDREQDAAVLRLLCDRYGGHHPYLKGADVFVTRPGKSAGTSASVGYSAPGIVKMFSKNWTPFAEGRRYVVEGDQLVDADESRLTPSKTATPTDPLVPSPDPPSPLDGADGRHYTDVGNADRLIEAHGDHVRYVPVWGRWLAYDGGRWRLDHADTLVGHLAASLGMGLLERISTVYGNEKQTKELLQWVRRSESAAGIAATLTVAASRPGVALDHEALDANPWLLNLRNGTLDLRGRFRPHDPRDLLTMQAAVNYVEGAVAHRWALFLEQVLPDHEVRRFVQRLAGLALLGDQPEHILPILLGGGANGKSTLTKVLATVLGDYAIVASRDVLLALKHDTHPTAKADLFRRRFAHSGELPPAAKLDEAQVKELTGGDRIKARRMREDFWEFSPSHLLWLHANHRPLIEGTDDGIWRRVHLIPFDVQIAPDARDPRLADHIIRDESAGVLNWMLNGLADYLADGLETPDVVQVATARYRNDSDTVAAFLAESGYQFNPRLELDAGDLLAAHGDWWQAIGATEPEKSHYQRVVAALKERGVSAGRTKSRGRFWRGIGTRGDNG